MCIRDWSKDGTRKYSVLTGDSGIPKYAIRRTGVTYASGFVRVVLENVTLAIANVKKPDCLTYVCWCDSA